MPFTLADYSRTATRPIRQAMALALADYVAGLTFFNPGAFQFQQVFTEWADYLDRVVYPSAVVLPAAWKYADSELVPSLLEDTLEPVDTDGNLISPGFGLEKLAEFEEEITLSFRTTSVGERDAILLGIESAFISPHGLMDDPAGGRNAVILPLPAYYSLLGRFEVVSARIEDDADSAMRNIRDAVLTISAQAPQVAVKPVFPLDCSIRVQF